jgi:hypothetical protein
MAKKIKFGGADTSFNFGANTARPKGSKGKSGKGKGGKGSGRGGGS